MSKWFNPGDQTKVGMDPRSSSTTCFYRNLAIFSETSRRSNEIWSPVGRRKSAGPDSRQPPLEITKATPGNPQSLELGSNQFEKESQSLKGLELAGWRVLHRILRLTEQWIGVVESIRIVFFDLSQPDSTAVRRDNILGTENPLCYTINGKRRAQAKPAPLISLLFAQ